MVMLSELAGYVPAIPDCISVCKPTKSEPELLLEIKRFPLGVSVGCKCSCLRDVAWLVVGQGRLRSAEGGPCILSSHATSVKSELLYYEYFWLGVV
jgi:hypothetical protein